MLDEFENEVWKPVVGYEGLYEVSNYGRVFSKFRIVNNILGYQKRVNEKMLTPTLIKKGYYSVMLSKDGKPKRFEVHRLVGNAFISETCQCFNHINGIKTDNRLVNLEASTFSDNINHAVDVLHKHSRALVVEIYDGESIDVFGSMAKAEKYLGKDRYWMKSKRNVLGNEFIFDNKLIKIKERLNE